MDLHQSGEMYLETIYVLSKQQKNVRSLDVAEYMNFSKPSISRAVKLLREGGFLTVDGEGFLSLTPSGREIAESLYERHTLLTELLVRLGVDRETAAEDACKIEHNLSETSFEAIKKHFAEHQ